jgi:protein TonB
VRFSVGSDGKLASAEVVRSAGSSREHKMLDRLAVAKLSECSFTAGSDENGRPVGASFDVDYVWKLD